jgi:signal transduction histidine kinase
VVLTSALRGDDAERLGNVVEQALERIDATIAGLQNLITDLRPAALDELGVEPAIEGLAERVRATSGVAVTLDIELAESSRLEPAVESTIYRLVQEGLTNAVKHARPERVEVALREDESRVAVTIRDDGAGFRPDASSRGFGLVGMRERVELVGGTLQLESTPGGGTTVRASVPARRGAQAADADAQAG